MLYGIARVHFFLFSFFFFFRHDFVRAISLEPLLTETPNWVCCLVLRTNCALLLTIQFALLFFFFFAKILSGPYLWNCYSQRLQIECAAWSCGLILHYCLPSNSLCYFFFRHDFVQAISLEPLLTETPNWVCCLVLRPNCALLFTIQFALLFIFFFVFSAKILSGPYLWNRYSQRLQIECAAWSCSLILHCGLPSNSLRYLFFFFSAMISSEPYLWNRYSQRLQIECAAWSCGLILHCCLKYNSLRYFFFLFFPPRFCPGHMSGTVTRRDSKLSVLLGPTV